MEKKRFSNGVEIPAIGLGVYQSPQGADTQNAVKWALQAGYRSLDTATIYQNEADVGKGMAESGVPREEIFLCSKVWNADIKARRVREAFFESLERLNTEYLDLYLIHWPVDGYQEAWREIERLYREKRIRAIGVSNFTIPHLEDLLSRAEIAPMLNQVESHPYLVQQEMIEYCTAHQMLTEVWSPLGGTGGNLLQDPVIGQLAEKYHRSPAQIVIRWDIQRGVIVIPKSTHKERIEENLRVFDFQLEPEDMERITAQNRGLRVGPDPDAMAERWKSI